jgi:PsbP
MGSRMIVRMVPWLLLAHAVVTAMCFSPPRWAVTRSTHRGASGLPMLLPDAEETKGSRRTWMRQSTIAAASLFRVSRSSAVAASEGKPQTLRDEKYGFTIDLPSNWSQLEDVTSLSDRRTIRVYTDPSDPSTSMVIVYTPIRDDFTSLNSFGSVDQVAAQTILPKGRLADVDTEVTAQMISATSTKQSYIFDYLQQVPQAQQPWTHYRTIFTLGKAQGNTAGAVLVTITLQTPELRYPMMQSTLDAIIDSYQRV